MRSILTLLAKDFALLRRNRAAFVLSFVVPMLIIYIVGLVFGLGRTDSGPTGIPLAVVNQSDNPAAQKLVAALSAEKTFRVITTFALPDKSTRPLTEADLRALIHDRQFSYALVIPPDLIGTDRLGLHLKLLSDPRSEIEAQIVNGILQKTIFSNVPQLLSGALQARAKAFLGDANADAFNRQIAHVVADNFGADEAVLLERIRQGDFGLDRLLTGKTPTSPTPASPTSAGPTTTPDSDSATADVFSRLVAIDREQVVGRDVKSPLATQIVGGYAVMFLLFALSNTAIAFFDEKNAGLFQRLLSSPVTRAQLLWSRFLYGVLFGLMQLTALFVAGHFLYGVDVFGHLGSLLLMCTAVAAACTGFGMLIAAITPSPQAAQSVATLLVIVMSACGGAWFPVSFMPEFMQHVARFTLVYWAIEGFGAVLWAGDTFARLAPILGLLLGLAATVMAVAVWRFNRSKLFD